MGFHPGAGEGEEGEVNLNAAFRKESSARSAADEVAAAAAGGQGVTPIQSTPLHIHAANNQIGSNLT